MYDVKTDHTIRATAGGGMELIDRDGRPIVTAFTLWERGPWAIQAVDGAVPDATALDRSAAITAMVDHALAVLGGTGYSTLVPHDVAALP